MNKHRQQRLLLVSWFICLLSIGIGSILYALRDNINVYLTPSQFKQVVSNKDSQTFQLGGMVVRGSFVRASGVSLKFDITDYKNKVTVYYKGILPALFKEGQGVIAIGRRTVAGELIAAQILAKHDEQYHPPMIKPEQMQEKKVLADGR